MPDFHLDVFNTKLYKNLVKKLKTASGRIVLKQGSLTGVINAVTSPQEIAKNLISKGTVVKEKLKKL